MPDPNAFVRLPPGHQVELPDPSRAPDDRLRREVAAVSRSPVVTAVLEVADAVLVVLNADRQIVGFNSRVAAIRAPSDVLALRPGELFDCVNAAGPGGCGAAPACRGCGALGAVLGCQEREVPVEAECVIRPRHDPGKTLELNVRAAPVTVDGGRFTVLSLRDISAEKRREALEQVFFHDVLNTVTGLRVWAQRLRRGNGEAPRAGDRIEFLSGHVEREIRDHRALLLAERGELVPGREPVRVADALRDVAEVFDGHPAAQDRRLAVEPPAQDVVLVCDRALVVRVLANMVRNALEATAPGGVVRAWAAREAGAAVLRVHNDAVIPAEVQARIFERSFSTKAPRGRGLGTYSMKLFGERHLGGRVAFSSLPGEGTVFSLALPLPAGEPAPPGGGPGPR